MYGESKANINYRNEKNYHYHYGLFFYTPQSLCTHIFSKEIFLVFNFNRYVFMFICILIKIAAAFNAILLQCKSAWIDVFESLHIWHCQLYTDSTWLCPFCRSFTETIILSPSEINTDRPAGTETWMEALHMAQNGDK